MFNDRFGLTEKVLEGNKTQTRRIIPQSVIDKVEEFRVEYYNMTFDALTTKESLYHYFFVEKNLGKLPYNVGEIVAVAQSYKEVFGEGCGKESEAGYNNKMFVKPELMPHQIRITKARIERLQDISMLCNLKTDFDNVIPLTDYHFTGDYTFDNGVFSSKTIQSANNNCSAIDVIGNGYEGNKYVKKDNGYLENILNTKNKKNMTDNNISTY